MLQYADKRSQPRTIYNMTVQIQELNDPSIHGARIGNYSRNGLYFETDRALHPGAEIYLGIDNSLYEASSTVHNRYRAKIVWIKKLENSIHNYGFGAEDTTDAEKQNPPGSELNEGTDFRKHPRKPYVKSVFFISQHQYHKGLINNISSGGVFIETKNGFSVGQIIKLVIPGTKIDKGVMLKGEVLHLSQTGIGVKFKSLLNNR